MLKTCARIDCRILYSSGSNGSYCPACKALEDTAFRTLRDYIDEHPTASVVEIYQATRVPMDVIEKLVRSGRLNYVHVPRCSRCLQALESGEQDTSICGRCRRSVCQEMNLLMSRSRIPATTQHAISQRKMYISHQ